MNFRNLALIYLLLIYFISPIDLLGEKVLKYQEIDPGGKFGKNGKRKLGDENYIIVEYFRETQYTKFTNDNRNGISYIIYMDKIINSTDSFTIQANNLIEIHFSSPITSLENFFNAEKDLNSRNINSVDLSHFDSSLVKSTSEMFLWCMNLKSIDFSNFDTSLVTDMNSMFYGCNNLKSLNLSNFNTSLVTNMNRMFSFCWGLKSVDVSNFDTSLVTDMNNMFFFVMV